MIKIKIKRLIILLGIVIILTTGLQQTFAITNEHGSTVPPVTVSWTAPIQYTDNSPINKILSFDVYVQCNERVKKIYTVLEGKTSYILPSKEIGLCEIKVRAISDMTSVWSTSVFKLIKLNKPKRGGIR